MEDKYRIIIFGTGIVYQRIKKYIDERNVVALVDNNVACHEMDGIRVISASEIKDYYYDYIIIASTLYWKEIQTQLIQLGVQRNQILLAHQIGKIFPTTPNQIIRGRNRQADDGDILMITYDFNINGAMRALYELGKSLSDMGFKVDVLAEMLGDESYIFIEAGFNIICGSETWWNNESLINLFSKYAVIVINTLELYEKADLLNNSNIPVIWWIHEPSVYYQNIVDMDTTGKIRGNNIHHFVVSKVGASIFKKYIPGIEPRLLVPCMEDCYKDDLSKNETLDEKITLAVVAAISQNKGQKVLLEALCLLSTEEQDKFRVILIGKETDKVYSRDIREVAAKLKNIGFGGEIRHEDVLQMYRDNKIDVLVCPSYEETLSLSTIEAMMFGKPAIVSDNVGVADYIENYYNGFIFESQNRESLTNILRWIIKNKNKLKNIGNRSRSIYDNYFTRPAFIDELNEVFQIEDIRERIKGIMKL